MPPPDKPVRIPSLTPAATDAKRGGRREWAGDQVVDRDRLEAWVAEFTTLGIMDEHAVDVLVHGGAATADAVGVHLRFASTATFVQPRPDGREWAVTFEAREVPAVLTANQVDALAEDLYATASLCRFLEARANGVMI